MSDRYELLAPGEVLCVANAPINTLGNTFKVAELTSAIERQVETPGLGEILAWFSHSGVSCEVLRFGASNWQSGQVCLQLQLARGETKVYVEFRPSNGVSIAPPDAFSRDGAASLAVDEDPDPDAASQLLEAVFGMEEAAIASDEATFPQPTATPAFGAADDEEEEGIGLAEIFGSDSSWETSDLSIEENNWDLEAIARNLDEELKLVEASKQSAHGDREALLETVWQELEEGSERRDDD